MSSELDVKAVNAIAKMAAAWERIADCAEEDLKLKALSVQSQMDLAESTKTTAKQIELLHLAGVGS